jgi:hypothetical protein
LVTPGTTPTAAWSGKSFAHVAANSPSTHSKSRNLSRTSDDAFINEDVGWTLDFEEAVMTGESSTPKKKGKGKTLVISNGGRRRY